MKDFLQHLFPRIIFEKNLRLSYTLCFGGLALSAFCLASVSGVLLLFYYRPDPQHAYEAILYLEAHVPGGYYVRNLHARASDAFVILMVFHGLRVVLTGAYRPPRHLNWLVGCALLFLGLFEAYTGTLLPMDQAALWATRTGMEILQLLPLGAGLKELLVVDGQAGALTLMRFYALHVVVLPGAIALLTGLHFYRIRKNSGILPYL